MKCDAKKCLRKAFLVLDWMWTRRHDSYRDGRDNIMQKEMLHWLVQQRMTMDGDPQRPFSPPWAFSMSRKAAHDSCPVHLWNSICIEDKKKKEWIQERWWTCQFLLYHWGTTYFQRFLSQPSHRNTFWQCTFLEKPQTCWNFTILRGQFSISCCDNAVIMVWLGSGTNTT